eukprot:4079-Heterococcus_DN1.PRE.11
MMIISSSLAKPAPPRASNLRINGFRVIRRRAASASGIELKHTRTLRALILLQCSLHSSTLQLRQLRDRKTIVAERMRCPFALLVLFTSAIGQPDLVVNTKSTSDIPTESSFFCKGDAASHGQWVQADNQTVFRTESGCTPRDWPSQAEMIRALTGKRIYLVGDSQTNMMSYKVFEAFDQVFGNHTVLRESDGRDPHRNSYFYLQRPAEPAMEAKHQRAGHGIGPVHFGLESPGSTDCAGCWTRHCLYWEHGFELILHASEFAKDTEMRSAQYNYTQEIIFKDFAQRFAPDYVLWNTGVHDMIDGDAADYENNLRWALSLIMSVQHTKPPKVLFWSSLPPLDDALGPQKHDLVRDFNSRAAAVMKENENAFYFDVFDDGDGPLGKTKHTDNIHMYKDVYDMIAREMSFSPVRFVHELLVRATCVFVERTDCNNICVTPRRL